MDSAINAADKRLNIINKDKEFQRYYRLRQMALSDYTSNMNYARNEGIQQGLAEGMEQGLQQGLAEGIQQGLQQGLAEGMEQGLQQGRAEAARNLKLLGVSADLIIKSTGLSQEEIAKL